MTRDVFLDANGEADPKKSRDSALGVGVPGTVAGLALAHEKYGSGKFTLAQLIAPAIRLAREGFAVEDDLADTDIAQRSRLIATLANQGDGRLVEPEARRLASGRSTGRPASFPRLANFSEHVYY